MSHANPNLAITFVPPYRATSAKISQQRLLGFSTNLRNFLAHNKRKALTELLLKLSIYEFWGDEDFTPSGIAETVRHLGRSEGMVGNDIAAAARELSQRWGKGDMNPRLLTTPLTIPAAVDFAAPVPAAPVPAPAIHGHNAILNAMMHGITHVRGIAPRLQIAARFGNMHGHNGLAIGSWWPFLVAARRDGAHATPQAGIHGNLVDGAFSVVVCGGLAYRGADNDRGDVVWYAGPKADNAVMTLGSQALVRSRETRKPVRVLRGARAGGLWAPDVGYRYDGLYRVESYALATRRKGKKEEFWRFKLVRCRGQEELRSVCNRSPRREESRAFKAYSGL